MDLDLEVPVTPLILEAESAWAGGVADFGDREAGYIVQGLPGYFEYRGTLEDKLRQQLGDSFYMYRAMTQDAFEAWRNGDDMGPTGFTFREGFARAWKNFAGMERVLQGEDIVVVRALINPGWVVMRGKLEEDELVVDANMISFNTLEVI